MSYYNQLCKPNAKGIDKSSNVLGGLANHLKRSEDGFFQVQHNYMEMKACTSKQTLYKCKWSGTKARSWSSRKIVQHLGRREKRTKGQGRLKDLREEGVNET